MSVTPNYVAQLVAEVVQVRMVKGKPVRVWVLPSGKRNDALDRAVYALAARESFGGQGLRGGNVIPAQQINKADAEAGAASSKDGKLSSKPTPAKKCITGMQLSCGRDLGARAK